MIQRVQSLFLLLATALGVALLAVPVATVGGQSVTVPGAGVLPAIAGALAAALPAAQIFLYKNRLRQIRIGRWAMAAAALMVALFVINLLQTPPADGVSADIAPRAAAIFPVAIVALEILANRAIRKDEELVRSIDRIR